MFVTNQWHNPEWTSDLGFLRSLSSHWLFEVKALGHHSGGNTMSAVFCYCVTDAYLSQWMPGNGKAHLGDHAAW